MRTNRMFNSRAESLLQAFCVWNELLKHLSDTGIGVVGLFLLEKVILQSHLAAFGELCESFKVPQKLSDSLTNLCGSTAET